MTLYSVADVTPASDELGADRAGLVNKRSIDMIEEASFKVAGNSIKTRKLGRS